MNIKSKKIIISGGCGDLGINLYHSLSKKKCLVGILDINSSAINDLKKKDKTNFFKYCDVTKSQDVSESIKLFVNKHGPIDILINMTGLLHNEPIISFSDKGVKKHKYSSWKKIINTNLNSVFLLTSNVLENMLNNRTKGLIINISSVAADCNVGQSAYAASKGAINTLTHTWSSELSHYGIRVAGISPGLTKTNSTKKIMSKNKLNEIIKKTPSLRLGEVTEIIESILFIIKNDFFNGKILNVDGGLRL